MKKRFIAWLLAVVMVISMVPTTAFAAEESGDDSVTVYMTVSKKSEFVEATKGTTMALEKITVPYFDLADYGLEALYYNPDCYAGGTKEAQVAGTKETAEGNVTILHLLIYATEIYQCELNPEEAGKGYLAEHDWPNFEVWDKTPGSAFINFWDFGQDVTYYLNYEYPLAYYGWGSTCDQILLEDGDSVYFRYDNNSGDEGTYYHFGEEGMVTKDLLAGNSLHLTLYKTSKTTDYSGTGHSTVGEGYTVSVVSAIGEDALVTAQTNASGDVTLDTSKLGKGTYYVISDSYDPAVMILNVKSDAHEHEYEAVVTEPTCVEGGYTTYTCSCGDSYVADRTGTVDHDFDEETRKCKYDCGYVKTDIPEGAPFTDIVADVPGEVIVHADVWESETLYMSIPYYHLELPEGTKGIKVTYPKDMLMLDQFGYAHAVAVPMFENYDAPDNLTFKYGENENGSVTVTIGVTNYITSVAYTGYAVTFVNYNNWSNPVINAFTFAYDLPEGYYHAVFPESDRYTVTGEATATNGYKFNVEIAEDYTPGENFAIKVNGETVATEPGEVTLETVDQDVYITVENVVVAPKPDDLFITVDFTDLEGTECTNSYVMVNGIDIEEWFDDAELYTAGESKTFSYVSGILEVFTVCFDFDNSEIKGFEVNGKKCAAPTKLEYTTYDVAENVQVQYYNTSCVGIVFGSYELGTVNPGEFVIKPILVDKVELAKEALTEAEAAAKEATEEATAKRKTADEAATEAETAKAAWEEAEAAVETAKAEAEEAEAAADAAKVAWEEAPEDEDLKAAYEAAVQTAEEKAAAYEAAVQAAEEKAAAYETAVQTATDAETEAVQAEINAAKAEAEVAKAEAEVAKEEAKVAKKAAVAAQKAAEAEKTAAEEAKAAAEEAQKAAEEAQATAEAERVAAEEAKAAAEEAQKAAEEAQAKAEEAQKAAEEAQAKVEELQNVVGADKEEVEAAKAAAEEAQAKAEAAQKAAEEAQTKAEEIQKAAAEAQAKAEEAQTAAEEAQKVAEAEKAAAEAAQTAAEAAQKAAEEAQKAAEAEKTAAEAAKTAAEEAQKAAEEAKKAAEAEKAEAEAAKKAAEEAQAKAEEAQKAAETEKAEAEAAKKAAEEAQAKAEEAQKAAAAEKAAAEAAKKAAEEAAAKAEAAQKAIEEASAKPAATKITSIKKAKKKLTIKWKKVTGASGYVIYRSTKKNGTYKKVKTIKKATTVKWTNKKLKSNKRYYYKVRVYKVVNGQKVYSTYSAVKFAKTK